jgi:hypothetical protein
MTKRPSANNTHEPVTATQPAAAVEAMNRRRVIPVESSVFLGAMLFLRRDRPAPR